MDSVSLRFVEDFIPLHYDALYERKKLTMQTMDFLLCTAKFVATRKYVNLHIYTSLLSEFLVTDPETRVRFPALPEKKVVGPERGPLSEYN
jgi:hypothetical protein